jgi:GNAT superfamily N-acetyltransferase
LAIRRGENIMRVGFRVGANARQRSMSAPPVRFHLPPPAVRPFASLTQGSVAPPATASGQDRAQGAVAFWTLVPRPGFEAIATAVALRRQEGSQYDVSFEELSAAWHLYYEPRRGSGHPSVDSRFSEYAAIADAQAAADPLSAPTQQHRDRRNALFDRLLQDLPASPYVVEFRLDRKTDALVPYDPTPQGKLLHLKGGAAVWMRPLGPADPDALARFLCDLSEKSFRQCFPAAPIEPEARERLAHQLVERSRHRFKVFVVEDGSSRIVALRIFEPLAHGPYKTSQVVADAMQGQGLGSALFQEACAFARHEGCQTLLFDASDTNEAELKLLRKMGVAEGVPNPRAPGHRTYTVDVRTPEDRRVEFVKLVQGRLIAREHYKGLPDGRLDDRTRGALRAFQRARGLDVTGKLTRETLHTLEFEPQPSLEFAEPGP